MTKLKLGLASAAFAAAAAGLAGSTTSASATTLPALKPLATEQSSAVQPVWWRRDCWWDYGRRHCRWHWHGHRHHHRWW